MQRVGTMWMMLVAAALPPSCFGFQAPDFTLGAAPATQTLWQAHSADVLLTVTAQNGFNGVVNFSSSGLPQGTSVSYVPTSVTGSGSLWSKSIPTSSDLFS